MAVFRFFSLSGIITKRFSGINVIERGVSNPFTIFSEVGQMIRSGVRRSHDKNDPPDSPSAKKMSKIFNGKSRNVRELYKLYKESENVLGTRT